MQLRDGFVRSLLIVFVGPCGDRVSQAPAPMTLDWGYQSPG